MEMSYQDVAKVGQIIRAYDFRPMPSREDCYVEGIVLDVGYISEFNFYGYTIKGTKDTMAEGEYTRVGELVYVPFKTFMDFEGRVELVA